MHGENGACDGGDEDAPFPHGRVHECAAEAECDFVEFEGCFAGGFVWCAVCSGSKEWIERRRGCVGGGICGLWGEDSVWLCHKWVGEGYGELGALVQTGKE